MRQDELTPMVNRAKNLHPNLSSVCYTPSGL